MAVVVAVAFVGVVSGFESCWISCYQLFFVFLEAILLRVVNGSCDQCFVLWVSGETFFRFGVIWKGQWWFLPDRAGEVRICVDGSGDSSIRSRCPYCRTVEVACSRCGRVFVFRHGLSSGNLYRYHVCPGVSSVLVNQRVVV